MQNTQIRTRLSAIHLAGLALVTFAFFGSAAATAQTRTVQIQLTPTSETAALTWTELANEGQGDVRSPRLPDAKSLSYHYDPTTDQLWFKIDLHGSLREDFFGVNLAIDTDSDQNNGFNWWGINQGFRFDRLLTVYLNQVGEAYQGSIGIGDVAGISQGKMDNLSFNNIRVSLDTAKNAILLGLKGSDLDDNLSFNLIATVGSSMIPNDDLPNTGQISLDLNPHAQATP